MNTIACISASILLLAATGAASAQGGHHHHRKAPQDISAAGYDGGRPYPDYGPVYRQACYGSEYNYGARECGSASGGPSGAPNQGG